MEVHKKNVGCILFSTSQAMPKLTQPNAHQTMGILFLVARMFIVCAHACVQCAHTVNNPSYCVNDRI